MNNRPTELPSKTYKLRIPTTANAFYITIADHVVDDELVPYELFINTKDLQKLETVTIMSRFVSTILRNKLDPQIAIKELHAIQRREGKALMGEAVMEEWGSSQQLKFEKPVSY